MYIIFHKIIINFWHQSIIILNLKFLNIYFKLIIKISKNCCIYWHLTNQKETIKIYLVHETSILCLYKELYMINDARQKRESAKEYAYRVLREKIISLELKPGTPLNDMEFAQMIGVSRTPVREAIIKLNEGAEIIDIFPQRGMRISLIDTDMVQEAQFLRLTLEKAIVELACDMASETDFRWFDENIALQKLYLKNNDLSKLLTQDNELHKKLFTICRKKMVYHVSQGLSIHYDRVRNLEAGTAIHDAETIKDHQNIIQAIKDKDKKD